MHKKMRILEKKRIKKFLAILKPLVNDPTQTLQQKDKVVFNWYIQNRKEFNDEKAKSEKIVSDETKLCVSTVEAQFLKKRNQKMHELIIKTDTWIQYIENELKGPKGLYFSNPEQKSKAQSMLTTLQSLTDVLKSRSGKLSLETGQELKRCFGQDRNWETAEADLLNVKVEEIAYLPINSSNKETNLVVLCLLGVITDTGARPLELIKHYIQSK
jgi:hypothetical protein